MVVAGGVVAHVLGVRRDGGVAVGGVVAEFVVEVVFGVVGVVVVGGVVAVGVGVVGGL